MCLRPPEWIFSLVSGPLRGPPAPSADGGRVVTAPDALANAMIYIYVNTTLYRNSRISRLNCGKTIKDRGLSFYMVPTHILKAKTAKFQVLTPFES